VGNESYGKIRVSHLITSGLQRFDICQRHGVRLGHWAAMDLPVKNIQTIAQMDVVMPGLLPSLVGKDRREASHVMLQTVNVLTAMLVGTVMIAVRVAKQVRRAFVVK